MSAIECGEMPGRHCGAWERQSQTTEPHSLTWRLDQRITALRAALMLVATAHPSGPVIAREALNKDDADARL